MKYVDLTLPTAAENLACDEALLDCCDAGHSDELLRFWQPQQHFVVAGYANRIASEVRLAACVANDVPIFRRCTGGGTVLQGPGCLNYSLILKIREDGPMQSITATNDYILRRHKAALEPLLHAPIQVQGHTDLAITSRKFSGNSQRRKRHFLLFHGTFLLNFDLALIEKFLAMPSKQPDYRHNRAHQDFLMNVGLAPALVKAALLEIWCAHEPLKNVPHRETRKLTEQKYSTDKWNFRFR